MRALWSQIPRPRAGGFPSISTCTNDPAAAILVRKTTTAPIRRRLTFNDAFTLLLTPVFATAFVVDTSWKEKQRRDWDKKLADIQDEIDQIHARELRVRSSLRLRSVPGGPLCQQRHYSASAASQTDCEAANDAGAGAGAGAENENEIEAPYWLLENNMSMEEYKDTKHSQSSTSEQLPPSDTESVRSYSDQDMSAAHRYHRLIATMLAIRLITHFNVVTKGYLKPVPDDMIEDKSGTAGFPEVKDLPSLVEMNQKLNRELYSLRRSYPDLNGLGSQIDKDYRESPLHLNILALVKDFREQKLDRYEFVQGYAKLILNSNHVPCTQTYVSMLKALGRAGHDSLAYYVVAALTSSKLPLTDDAVGHMLLSIGKARDSPQFDKFLKGVIQSRPTKHNLVGKWQLYMSKNGAVPVPNNLNPNILQALIYMALRTQQTNRAEVWSSFLEEMNFASTSASHLFSSFLQAYALDQHWDAGLLWLRRSVHHATLLAAKSIDALSRVIFRMLDLCVACRRLPEYTTILDAAINAGIPPPAVHTYRPQRFTPRARNILLEWKSLMAPTNDPGSLTDDQRVLKFQELCKLHEPDFSETPSKTYQNPKDELVINAPNKKFVRYTVTNTDQISSSNPGDAVSDTTRSQFKNIQSLFEKHHSEIRFLKGQIELARQAIRPLQQDLDATQKRDVEQRQLILNLQNQLAESQTVLEGLPATLSSLKSMQAEIATLKASLQEFQKRSPIDKNKSKQALAKDQDSLESNVIHKHMVTDWVYDSREYIFDRKRHRVGGIKRPLLPDFEAAAGKEEEEDPNVVEGDLECQPRRVSFDSSRQKPRRIPIEYRFTNFRPFKSPKIEEDPLILGDNDSDPSLEDTPPPKVDNTPTAHGSADLLDVRSVIEKSLSQGRRGPGAYKIYRLDLSKIGHAIPDDKNSLPTSSEAGEEEENPDNHVPRFRRQY